MAERASKFYFQQSLRKGLHWFTNALGNHITIRFAGNPSFLLEKYKEKYGENEGAEKYRELLLILKDIGDEGFSPFVLYINNKK